MHEELRQLALLEVLVSLGVTTDWKTRKGGSEWYGRCPLHEAKKNQTSFSFDAQGRFNCFSCSKKGKGAIDLVMAFKGVGFQEAVTWLQGHVHSVSTSVERVQIPTENIHVTENPVFKSTYEKFKTESSWLKERGFTQETLERYGVFEYNNPKRRSAYNGQVMISIRRFLDGEVVGYLIREKLGRPDFPKYLWPKNVLKSLEVHGAYQLKTSQLPLRVAYLVESPFAVMHFHQLGFPAVSCYGWSVSPQQVAILTQLARGWIYLPDSNKRDSIGQVLHLLSQTWVKAPEYPAEDPELLTAEQIRSL